MQVTELCSDMRGSVEAVFPTMLGDFLGELANLNCPLCRSLVVACFFC